MVVVGYRGRWTPRVAFLPEIWIDFLKAAKRIFEFLNIATRKKCDLNDKIKTQFLN